MPVSRRGELAAGQLCGLGSATSTPGGREATRGWGGRLGQRIDLTCSFFCLYVCLGVFWRGAVLFRVWFRLAPFSRRPPRSLAVGTAPRRTEGSGRSALAVAELAPAPPLTPQGQGQGEGLIFPELTGTMR